MTIIPLYLTLLSTLISGLLGRKIGIRGTQLLCIICSIISMLSSIILYYEVIYGQCEIYIDLFKTWFILDSLEIKWEIYIDNFTASMYITVSVVSLSVFIYTAEYMKNEPHLVLFYSYLSLFTLFMYILISGSSLFIMLLGWEGIGVCSYLLISYYSNRLTSTKSAHKAIVVNRISDGLLLWCIIWLWWYTGTVDYTTIGLTKSEEISIFCSIALLLGCMSKSVQIFLHVWLADSMEGPTPVSALIHAATLVTAGIYCLIRLSFCCTSLVCIVGSLTAIMAALFGLFQNDLKRVIAFSTCSQCGYMLVSIGLGDLGVEASMSHLMAHASFKAGLFLAAGAIIMSMNNNQNLGRYGSITGRHFTFIGYCTFLICSLSLMGFPETTGFYSKEAIMNCSFIVHNTFTDLTHTLCIFTAFLTSIYTFKCCLHAFFYDYNGLSFTFLSLFKNNSFYFSVSFCILLIDIISKIWIGTSYLSGILLFCPFIIKTLPFALFIAGFLTATSAVTTSNFTFLRFTATRWGFDIIYARTFVHYILDLGRITWTAGDKGLFFIK